MLSKTHLIFALFILTFFYSPSLNFLLFSLIVLFSTLIPDLDNSSIGILLKHRGIMHSLAFALIISLILAQLIPLYFVLAFLLGYVLHLFADIMTISGIPLLWPLKNRTKLKLFRTGGFYEKIVFCILLVSFVFKTIILITR